MAGGLNATLPVIPGRGAAASPKSKNTGHWNMDSGLALAGPPGMTVDWDLE
jgi:hypothetical protein